VSESDGASPQSIAGVCDPVLAGRRSAKGHRAGGHRANGHSAPTGPAQRAAVVVDGFRPTKPGVRIRPPRWERRYSWTVVASDLVALCLALSLGAWMAPGDNSVTPYTSRWMALVIFVGYLVAMAACRVWEPRVLGNGSEEYSRVARAVVSSSVTLGMTALAFKVESVRPWVFLIIPVAGVLTVLGRYALRKPLHRRRMCGQCLHPVLAVGSEVFITDLLNRTHRDPRHGWRVSAACTPSGTEEHIAGIPVFGDLDSATAAALSGEYGVVAVAPVEGWTLQRLHQFSWDLEVCGADLVVHPGLMEVSGPGLHVSPVDGLPLLRLTEPTYTGIPRLLKAGIDIVGAALLLVILAPVLLAVYLAVRVDGGPGFFRQTRIGRKGRPFWMLKFRTTVPDAGRMRNDLLEANEDSGPLFKLKSHPRVTPVGAALRSYSLDELPQLFNVLLGSMSLIGPRPPLPEEVARYARDARRKLLVKPGLTGLWRISGRSDLSWEESVRLDLRYVENWTLALDVLILWKTFKAVISSDGAY
jgi:exopolysaccharide biosynthesis polyprenyl glycosylphosphotransferase